MVEELARFDSSHVRKLVRVGREWGNRLNSVLRFRKTNLRSVIRALHHRPVARVLHEGLVGVEAPNVTPLTLKPVPRVI
ncbi:hypothetical protein B296_00037782 [Ensete ventricosum]|uniref:Uncharacterized protein n=1 Tax=Ensete ventricosum TaxID=4639 RepID=A0A426XY71_ENSVE|nr:hypothetical protein B296_00037782 [Ensete ventricosum]